MYAAWARTGDLAVHSHTSARHTWSLLLADGWQGNLSALHCVDSDIAAVDVNWAKLAAKGISVLISSGDSGSGFTSKECDRDSYLKDTSVTSGTLSDTLKVEKMHELFQTCLLARVLPSFVPYLLTYSLTYLHRHPFRHLQRNGGCVLRHVCADG